MRAADETKEIIRVGLVTSLETPGFKALHKDALQSGFGALTRLVDDWRSGVNRFAQPGEVLLAAWISERLVGVCGLNIDPYANRADTGRIRKLYVVRNARRKGVGKILVLAIEAAASDNGMSTLHLRTHDPASATFYKALGYVPIKGDATVTHRKALAP